MLDVLKNAPLHCIVVQADPKGKILDLACNSLDNAYHNCLGIIMNSLKNSTNIRDFFNIPENRAILLQQPYGAKAGLVNFENEAEEFHSLHPMAFIRFYNVNGNELIGFVNIAVFFSAVLFETRLHPLFQTDDNGLLLGYNRRFFNLVGGKKQSANALLGHPVSEFLEPSPLKIQQDILGKTAAPDRKEFTPLHQTESIAAGEPPPALGPIKWVDHDFLVCFKTGPNGTGLPSLVFGDAPDKAAPDFPDRNGYMVGPGAQQQSMILKKDGIPLWEKWLGDNTLPPGEYCFQKSGATFTVWKEGCLLFGFTDLEFIERPEVHLSFYFRTGRTVALSGLFIGSRPGKPGAVHRNIFTALRKRPDRYFHYSCIDSHADPERGHSRFFYRLLDMSDVKVRLDSLQKAYESSLLREREATLELQQYREGEGAFIASGKAMSAVREKAEKIALTTASVLIEGETGTGKEVLARFIHRLSPYSRGPFVKVDCSTLPKTLMESLLFGHEKGAFTGAESEKKGLFESAAGGTLFLDEISNLGMDIQAKLLGFLQDHTITPVGGQRPVKLDLRIIVASNVPLEKLISQGAFRQDLYYRVAVAAIALPRLRDHREDIPLLAKYFLDNLNLKYHKSIHGFDAGAMKALHHHPWPGNIRELKNAIERAFMYCDGSVISEDILSLPETSALPDAQSGPARRGRKPHQALDLSKEEMVEMLRRNGGMVKHMADAMGVTTRSLYYCFKKHSISPNSLRRNPRKQ